MLAKFAVRILRCRKTVEMDDPVLDDDRRDGGRIGGSEAELDRDAIVLPV